MKRFINWIKTWFTYLSIELSDFFKVLIFALIGFIISECISKILR